MRSALRGFVIGVVAAAMFAGTTVLAGNGVGAVFNLGATNRANAKSVLTGNVGNDAQLSVVNNATAANSVGVRGTSATGAGVQGINTSGGPGVVGISDHGIGVRSVSDSSGPAAQVTNNGAGPGLDIVTSNSAPPLRVNSSTKVDNLNADQLDGYTSSQFMRATGTVVFGSHDPLAPGSSQTVVICCKPNDHIYIWNAYPVPGGTVSLDVETAAPADDGTFTYRLTVHNTGTLAVRFAIRAIQIDNPVIFPDYPGFVGAAPNGFDIKVLPPVADGQRSISTKGAK